MADNINTAKTISNRCLQRMERNTRWNSLEFPLFTPSFGKCRKKVRIQKEWTDIDLKPSETLMVRSSLVNKFVRENIYGRSVKSARMGARAVVIIQYSIYLYKINFKDTKFHWTYTHENIYCLNKI